MTKLGAHGARIASAPCPTDAVDKEPEAWMKVMAELRAAGERIEMAVTELQTAKLRRLRAHERQSSGGSEPIEVDKGCEAWSRVDVKHSTEVWVRKGTEVLLKNRNGSWRTFMADGEQFRRPDNVTYFINAAIEGAVNAFWANNQKEMKRRTSSPSSTGTSSMRPSKHTERPSPEASSTQLRTQAHRLKRKAAHRDLLAVFANEGVQVSMPCPTAGTRPIETVKFSAGVVKRVCWV